MKLKLTHIFQESGLPLTTRTFWRAAAWFWGSFAVLSYVFATLNYWVADRPMYATENLHWLLRWSMWLGNTYFIVVLAHRFPLLSGPAWRVAPRSVGLHLLSCAVLSFGTELLLYGVLSPFYAREGSDYTLRMMVGLVLGRFNAALAIYLLVVLGYGVLAFVYRNRQLETTNAAYAVHNAQLQTQLSEAQLHALRMQLNPHFLFNAHQAIIGLIMQHDNQQAIAMVNALSEMLRSVIADAPRAVVTLREELDFVDKYLGVQQIRFQDKLTVHRAIGADTLDLPLPSFILQPLVENAVVHGIEGLAENGRLTLRARRQGPVLEVSVHDNGSGRPDHHPWRPARTGVGLKNTAARLQQLYGDAAELRFEQPPGQGTTVTLRIPIPATS